MPTRRLVIDDAELFNGYRRDRRAISGQCRWLLAGNVTRCSEPVVKRVLACRLGVIDLRSIMVVSAGTRQPTALDEIEMDVVREPADSENSPVCSDWTQSSGGVTERNRENPSTTRRH